MNYHRAQVLHVQPPTRRLLMAMALIAFSAIDPTAYGEQIDAQRPTHTAPVSRPPLIIRGEELFPLTPPTRIGMFTLVRPQTDGEIVRLAVPVGDLISRAAQAYAGANRRRAERKADERVRQDLEKFLAARTTNNRDR